MSTSNQYQLYSNALKKQALNPVGLNKSINNTHEADGYNASCGDEITIYLELDNIDNTVNNISFETDSCAICRASASLMCQSVKSLTLNESVKIKNKLLAMLNAEESEDLKFITKVDLQPLSPVSQFPSRVNCALLPWETLMNAYNNKSNRSALK